MTNLVYYQPWSLMDRWRREVDELLSGRSNASQPAVTNTTAWSPSVDLQEENDRFVLRADVPGVAAKEDRKSTRLNSSHMSISYAVFCLKKKKKKTHASHLKHKHCSELHAFKNLWRNKNLATIAS